MHVKTFQTPLSRDCSKPVHLKNSNTLINPTHSNTSKEFKYPYKSYTQQHFFRCTNHKAMDLIYFKKEAPKKKLQKFLILLINLLVMVLIKVMQQVMH